MLIFAYNSGGVMSWAGSDPGTPASKGKSNPLYGPLGGLFYGAIG